MPYFRELLDYLDKGKVRTKAELQELKKRLAEKYKLARFPSDADILQKSGRLKQKLAGLLRKKPSRTLSGVAVLAVMTKPSACPHGQCAYCPGGPDKGTAQSYSGREPSGMRAAQHSFDAFAQAKARLEQLEANGHSCEKTEVIIQGGTFTAMEYAYQEQFVKRVFDALNDKASKTLADAHKLNEKAERRCVGLTIETRPDWCKPHHIDNILEFGGTRVELGVQNPDDDVYRKVERGHTVADVAESTRLLKDSFLKVCYHLMPGLPGSTPDKDVKMFETVFTDEEFKPDMLKVYPCLLLRPEYGQKKLHKMLIRGEWKPLSDREAVKIIADAKRYVPEWCRIMRIQRDIPSPLVFAGAKHTNLRQLVKAECDKRGQKCKCIRCREVRADRTAPADAEIETFEYKASGGKEAFISAVADNKLLGFCRLRLPGAPFRPEITADTAGVRELHVYGLSVPVGEREDGAIQHKGLGGRLLAEAERIAAGDWGCKKLLVTSGVGAREYYRRFGYEFEGAYMSKKLAKSRRRISF